MRGIVWLASYPKSGNTWIRVFLTNYLAGAEEPADINHLTVGTNASVRELFDDLAGVEASDLTELEIELLRPAVYRTMVSQATSTIFIKTHEAWAQTEGGLPIVGGPEVTQGVLYLIRNPLDVAISFASHSGISIDQAIDTLADEGATFAGGLEHLPRQLAQPLRSWGGHVQSWVDQSGLPMHLFRYEDLCRQPMETFSGIVKAVGLDFDRDRVARAIEFSSFEVLQAQEQESGFGERAPRSERFFRKGVSGDWREQLDQNQVDRIVSAHRETMQRYGYLDDTGGLPPGPGQNASSGESTNR